MSVHPAARAAWLAAGSVLAVAALGLGTLNVVSLLAHGEERVVDEVDAAGLTTLELRAGQTGGVRIVAADTDVVRVVARVQNGLGTTRHEIERQGDRVVVRSSCPGDFVSTWCYVDYEIEVPAGLAVVGSIEGSADVRGIEGGLDLVTDSGSLTADGVAGSVRLRSDSGSVAVRRARSEVVVAASDSGGVVVETEVVPRTIDATSDSGSVEVVVPPGETSYLVDARSDSGAADVVVRTDPSSTRSILVRSDSGDVRVRYAS